MTAREVRRDGAAVPMTPAEFRLLEVLASNPGRAWTRADLAERAFGHEYDALDRTIDAHVMNLRRKLERDRANPELIQTVFGIGYRFPGIGDAPMRSLRARVFVTVALVLAAATVAAGLLSRRATLVEERADRRSAPPAAA